ncbi:type IV pili twitching motility protein PilT, partial [Soehngenia saccharolytica]
MTHFICIREINYKKGLVMNMNVREILENITKEHASDIFV